MRRCAGLRKQAEVILCITWDLSIARAPYHTKRRMGLCSCAAAPACGGQVTYSPTSRTFSCKHTQHLDKKIVWPFACPSPCPCRLHTAKAAKRRCFSRHNNSKPPSPLPSCGYRRSAIFTSSTLGVGKFLCSGNQGCNNEFLVLCRVEKKMKPLKHCGHVLQGLSLSQLQMHGKEGS